MRPGRGGEQLIQALQSVESAGLVFLGYGPEKPKLQDLAATLGIASRVAFLEPVPVSEIVPVLAGAQAGVTFLEDSCLNHRLALPNKLFDYFAAGLPVLGSALPEIERVLTLYNAGLTADPLDVGRLSPAIDRVLSDESARSGWQAGARRAAETFDWDSASERFVAQMTAVVDLPTQ
jgi:glycosyltransferase involved in cell wall biosynthesis